MSTKVKILRSFTFKAYQANKSEKVLNDAHSGKFLLKSECHYYCEKGVLDYVKNNLNNLKEGDTFLIYKISTLEDSNIKDMLIEQINVKEGQIIIF